MRPFQKMYAMLGALLLSCALLIGFSTTANASSPTCYGDYCSDQDPVATNCEVGAWTQRYVDVYYDKMVPFYKNHYAGRLELRASDTCGTQWARFTAAAEIVYTLRVIQPDTGYKTSPQSTYLDDGEGQDSWSNQVYSPNNCVYGEIGLYDPESFAFVGPTNDRTECV